MEVAAALEKLVGLGRQGGSGWFTRMINSEDPPIEIGRRLVPPRGRSRCVGCGAQGARR